MSDVLEQLAAVRIVPVLTFRTDAAAEAIRRAAEIDGLLVGAGTVLTPEQLGRAVDAGARFAVAPGTNDDVVAAALRAGVPFVPGVATPSEIEHAGSLGCTVLKVFPASVLGGPAFVKAVAPVYPDVRFVPTGGISPENLASYLELPAVLACGGTWICERGLLDEQRFDEVERRAREAVALASVAVAA